MRAVPPIPIVDGGGAAFSRASEATYFDLQRYLRTAAVDVPRINSEPGEGGAYLLLEAEGTNLSPYSEDLTQWILSGASVTPSATNAPDQELTADLLVESNTNAAHYTETLTSTITAGAKFTVTVFIRRGTRNWCHLQVRAKNGTASTASISFNANIGTVAGGGFSGDSVITTGGATCDALDRDRVAIADWHRIIFRGVKLASDVTQVGLRVYLQQGDGLSPIDPSVVTYLGDGASGLYIWGADIKEGGYSSYVPTPSSTPVTRAADSYGGDMMVSNVQETEPQWSVGGSYARDEVVRGNTAETEHKRFVSQQDFNSGHDLSDPDWWFEDGVTNRFGMFDQLRSTGTTAPSPLQVAIRPGRRVDTVALLGLIADRFTIEVRVGGEPVFSETTDLVSRDVDDWFEYFFEEFRQATEWASFNIPPHSNPEIVVTLERDSGDVTVGALIIGQSIFLGDAETGATDSEINYSKVDRDDFGTASFVKRRSVPTTRQTLWCPAKNVPDARRARELTSGLPALWVGIEEQDNPYYSSFLILGFARTFDIQGAYATEALIDLELEEI
jgi:hypothetical protein